MNHCQWMRQTLTAGVLFFAGVAVAGCGGGSGARYAVEGTVTLNSQSVDGGKILFLPMEDSGVKAHALIVGGKFSLDAGTGPNAGKYKVEIVWYKKTGKKVMNDGKEIDETEQVVPANYNVQSKTMVEIKPEKNTFAFDMKGDAPGKAGSKKQRSDGN
jgi:hypothetical protein